MRYFKILQALLQYLKCRCDYILDTWIFWNYLLRYYKLDRGKKEQKIRHYIGMENASLRICLFPSFASLTYQKPLILTGRFFILISGLWLYYPWLTYSPCWSGNGPSTNISQHPFDWYSESCESGNRHKLLISKL